MCFVCLVDMLKEARSAGGRFLMVNCDDQAMASLGFSVQGGQMREVAVVTKFGGRPKVDELSVEQYVQYHVAASPEMTGKLSAPVIRKHPPHPLAEKSVSHEKGRGEEALEMRLFRRDPKDWVHCATVPP